MKRNRWHRALAGFLYLCMVVSMFDGLPVPVFAVESSTGSPTSGATRQADPSTMDTYQNVLNFSENTRYAGRLWTDKTVYAYDYDNGDKDWKNNVLNLNKNDDGVNGKVTLDADFLHVYSVLGSSVQINDPAPTDLVLALDISGSMNSPLDNEIEGWVNTVNPKDSATFAQGLGFYRGNADVITYDAASNGSVVTVQQEGYAGYENDTNGIPDAIVSVLPENGKTLGTGSDGSPVVQGQMVSSQVVSYNRYLAFCNKLVDAIKAEHAADDNQITAEEATRITATLQAAVGASGDLAGNSYLAQYLAKTENTQAGAYANIYGAYLTYKNSANGIFGGGSDPWRSYNTDTTVRNAAWPNEDWDNAVKAAAVSVPENPLKNAGNAPNRMYYVIDAANRFIDQYLSLNKKNRISVIVYDSVATVLMPLAHYEKATVNGETQNYLSAEKHHWQCWSSGQWASTVSVTAVPISGYKGDPFGVNLKNNVYSASVTSWSNTGTVIALNAGLDILAHSDDAYGDQTERTPIMVLMTDGAANITLTTGLGTNVTTEASGKQSFNVDWTANVEKTTTAANKNPFNKYDGLVLKDGRTYETLNNTEGFKDKTSAGLTVYGAGYDHMYGSESDADLRYAVVLNTLMSTAYRKTLVEQHYNATKSNQNPAYPDDEADQAEWTEAHIYTIGFGLNYYDENTQGVCKEVLDPASYFNKQHVDEELKKAETDASKKDFAQALEKMYTGYTNWKNNTAGGSHTVSVTKSGIISDDANATGSLTLNFPITQSDLNGKTVTKADIDRNITYNTEYFAAVLGKSADNTLEEVFNQILSKIEGEMFVPVGGSNDLGMSDSITYMDPMGKYMEVKDVKSLVLFGEIFGITKTAVYSYEWNALYMKNSHYNEEKDALPEGWYKGDPTEGDNSGVKVVLNGLPSGCSSAEDAWKKGWIYRVGFKTAAQFVPNLEDVSSLADIDEKQKNTEYTFYRIAKSDEERKKLRMNPAYGTEITSKMPGYNINGAHLQTPGVYTFADMRIWVENTGDYNDSQVENGALQSDANFDEALYINIPVNMLPMRTVTIDRVSKDNVTYTSQTDTFPIRVFYTVGIESSLLTSDGSLNIAAGVSPNYIKNNKTTDISAKENARNISTDMGVVEFFSNWYNPEARYAAYDYSRLNNGDYTFGAPVVSFSPNTENSYYVFEKAFPLYSRAFIYKDNQWKQVSLNETDIDPTNFGGKLIAQDLNISVTSSADADAKIRSALNSKGVTEILDGDIVLLKNDRLTDVTRPATINAANPDPFASSGYYYLPLEYFDLNGEEAETVQYVVVRKGSEFGSAYQTAGITNGDMLCWHDVSGKYPDYRYLSYTDTGDSSRGYNYIGYNDADIFNVDANGNTTTLKTIAELGAEKKAQADKIRNDGEWVVSARPGGLRVGDMTQSVGGKGGQYKSYSNDYINERFQNADVQKLTWGYYENNVSRTANNYYLPTVSTASNIVNENIVINVYLGNNGRLWVPDTTLLLTKLVEPGPSGELPSDDSIAEFDFQVYIRDFVGVREAIRVRYNQTTKTWQQQLHSVDLELDGNRYLQTNDGQKVMVDANGKQVIQIPGNSESIIYVYADDVNTIYTGDLFYVHIAESDQSNVGGSATSFRLYHNLYCEESDGTVKSEDVVVHYYTGVGDKETKVESQAAPENFNGKMDFYAASGMVSLVSKSVYDNTDATKIGSLNGNVFDKPFYLATINPMTKNENANTEVNVESPYSIESTFLTQTLYFGYKHGATAAGDTISGDRLTQSDLYVPASDAAYDDNENPQENTAEVKLESGWGLLFNSIDSGVDYVMVERLKDETIAKGYSFVRVNQVTQSGTVNKQASEYAGYDYYVSGDTGSKEEAAHFINMWSDDKKEKQINGQNIPNNGSALKPGVQEEDVIAYEIQWANNTGKSARVVITDPLDKGVDFVSAGNGGRYFKTQAEANAYLKAQGLKFTVDYGHVVIWDLNNQNDGAKGTITLSVKVNEKASQWWSYSNDGVAKEPADGNTSNDYLVRNRATIRVAENVWNTNTLLNPVGEPEKTETAIERGENSTASHYEDEVVTEVGANANLLLAADGKYKGPLVFDQDKITYEISWRNYENQEAVISISDPLDPNVRFISAEYDPDDVKDHDGETITGLNPNTQQKIVAASDDGDVVSTEEIEGYGDDGTEKRNIIAYDAEDHTVVWNLGNMPAGASGKVTLVVEVLESAVPAGYVDNTAYVQVKNQVQQTKTLRNPTPHQEKTEVAPGDGVMVELGGSITYAVNWTNYKTQPAKVIIMDTLDPGVDFVAADQKGKYYKNGGTLTDENANEIEIPAHTVVWQLEKQPEGAKGTVTLTVKVNEKAKIDYKYNKDADGFESSDEKDYEVLNQARVKVGNDAFVKTQIIENPIPEKKETAISHVTGTEEDDPALTLKSETDNTYTGPLVFVEDEITYTIHWKNGHQEKADVIISDPLDKGVDFVSADNNGTYDSKTHTVNWKLTDQEAGSEGDVQLRVKVNTRATEVGVIDNQAKVKVGNDPFVNTEIMENPTPHEEKTEVNPGEGMQVMTGDEIDYQITWHNYEETESKVVITDKLDPGVDFVSAGVAGIKDELLDSKCVLEMPDPDEETGEDADSDSFKLGDEAPTFAKTLTDQNISMYYFKEAHTVVWVLENRLANSEGFVNLKVCVNEAAEKFWSYDDPSADPSDELNDDRVRNQAAVKVADNPEVKTRIIENPLKPEKKETSVNNTDVSRDLVADENGYVGPEVNVGDTITYQITWMNNASDKNGKPAKAKILIMDKLDPGVDFISASDGGSYNKVSHTVTWNLGEKNAKDRGIVTLTVRVNSKASTPKEVENVATVTVGNKAIQTNKVENPVGTKGNLMVSKTVTGNEGETDRNWTFTVTLSDKSINGEYGDMFFVKGVATFNLKHNESIQSSGLPSDILYTVVEKEANQDGYTTSAVGDTGSIPNGDTAKAEFTNDKNIIPPPTTDYPPANEPNTGDGRDLGYWRLMIGSMLGMLTVLLSRKRKNDFQI